MSDKLKNIVREKYAKVVTESKDSSCCSPSCCGDNKETMTAFNEDYTQLEGYVADADYNLGCGMPLEHIDVKPGMTVLDLGSGAGNDAFIAARMVGEEGEVIGIDFTPEMVEKARTNQAKLGLKHVRFVQGDIEDMPLPDDTVDLVISNCVLNLVPDKQKAYAEIKRVLRPNGQFAISDVVLQGDLPDSLREAAALYAGCVSGALQAEEYMQIVREAGFTDAKVAKAREIYLPDEFLQEHLSEEQIREFRESELGIWSYTVIGGRSSGSTVSA